MPDENSGATIVLMVPKLAIRRPPYMGRHQASPGNFLRRQAGGGDGLHENDRRECDRMPSSAKAGNTRAETLV